MDDPRRRREEGPRRVLCHLPRRRPRPARLRAVDDGGAFAYAYGAATAPRARSSAPWSRTSPTASWRQTSSPTTRRSPSSACAMRRRSRSSSRACSRSAGGRDWCPSARRDRRDEDRGERLARCQPQLRADAREILAEAAETDRREDELYGEARGDELPEHLRTGEGRRAALRAARSGSSTRQSAKRRQTSSVTALGRLTKARSSSTLSALSPAATAAAPGFARPAARSTSSAHARRGRSPARTQSGCLRQPAGWSRSSPSS